MNHDRHKGVEEEKKLKELQKDFDEKEVSLSNLFSAFIESKQSSKEEEKFGFGEDLRVNEKLAQKFMELK